MIISDVHKYVFVELPQTGSSAISKELRLHYDGRSILKKHATYRDFLKIASGDEKDYFVVSGIRNPMDKIVSLYFKYKTNHRKAISSRGGYDDLSGYRESNFLIARLMRHQFRYVQREENEFSDFFLRFFKLPYNDWSSLDHRYLDYIIRFENLVDDFTEALRQIGVTQVRALPVQNRTKSRTEDFWSYYPPHTRRRAQWVFGPYFRRWGYTFPAAWEFRHSSSSEIAFFLANRFRHLYWRFVH